MKRLLPIISVIVVFLDQLTKFLIEKNFDLLQQKEVNNYFNLVLVHNTGGAFGFLAQNSANNCLLAFSFICITITIVCLLIVYFFKTLKNKNIYLSLGISLVIAGALGNIFDRIFHNYVVDFLDFHIKFYHWPAFNIADIAIVVGALLILFFTNKKTSYDQPK